MFKTSHVISYQFPTCNNTSSRDLEKFKRIGLEMENLLLRSKEGVESGIVRGKLKDEDTPPDKIYDGYSLYYFVNRKTRTE